MTGRGTRRRRRRCRRSCPRGKFIHRFFMSSTTMYIICRDKTLSHISFSETYASFLCFFRCFFDFGHRRMAPLPRMKQNLKKTAKTARKGTTTMMTSTLTMKRMTRLLQSPSTKSVLLTRSLKRKLHKAPRKSRLENCKSPGALHQLLPASKIQVKTVA